MSLRIVRFLSAERFCLKIEQQQIPQNKGKQKKIQKQKPSYCYYQNHKECQAKTEKQENYKLNCSASLLSITMINISILVNFLLL